MNCSYSSIRLEHSPYKGEVSRSNRDASTNIAEREECNSLAQETGSAIARGLGQFGNHKSNKMRARHDFSYRLRREAKSEFSRSYRRTMKQIVESWIDEVAE